MMGADSFAKEMKEARRLCLTKHLGTCTGVCELQENGMFSIWTLGLRVEKLCGLVKGNKPQSWIQCLMLLNLSESQFLGQ